MWAGDVLATGNGVLLNDLHSGLNPTRVRGVVRPDCLSALRRVLSMAEQDELPVSIVGARHAMGGQQFGEDTIAIDMRGLNRVLGLDAGRGIVELEAGITWPEVLAFLDGSRAHHGPAAGPHGWAIAQKQTGADALTLGGAVAANVHGRGLTKAPIIEDLESLTLVDAAGQVVTCSRDENAELFGLVVGGYGLFGIVYSVRLRLVPRRKLQRVVRTIGVDALMGRFDERIAGGFQFGDFQFHIDDRSPEFLRRGVFSCYRPVDDDTPMPAEVPALREDDWMHLLSLAHVDKSRGFEVYSDHYARTDGAVYWSDAHQFTTYVDGYHEVIDHRCGCGRKRSEMISELYVPRAVLSRFLAAAAGDLRRSGASVIYGTVRLIERDAESFLAWAREPWACVIFNLCVEHSDEGLHQARRIFRQLIDRAIECGGSYYLTYHSFARRDQVEAAHPRVRAFLCAKRRLDPGLRFQSTWWRHYDRMFAP